MELWAQILSVLGALLGGGVLVKLYEAYRTSRKDDQTFISDRFRQIIEADHERAQRLEKALDRTREKMALQLTEIMELRAEVKGFQREHGVSEGSGSNG